MTVHVLLPLNTLPTENEQAVTTPKVAAATGTSREYREFVGFSKASFFLHVTAASGVVPTLDVVVQYRNEQNPTIWHTLVTFPQQTAATGGTPITPIAADILAETYRAVWTITGTTPSFSFTLNCVMTA